MSGRRAAGPAVAAGALGSAAIAVGGFGIGAVPASVATGWLHATRSGRTVSIALCIVGGLLLIGGWWLLRGASSRVLLWAAGLWSLPLLVAPSLFSRDVYAYGGQAHLVAVGLDPYTHGPGDAPGPLADEVDDVWLAAASPYGPVFLRLARLVLPGEHALLTVYVLRLLSVLGLALMAWGLLRLSRDPSKALWLGVANPLVLLHGIGGAHNDLLMSGLLVAGVGVAGASLAAAAVMVTLAALVKAPAVIGLLFLPFLVARRAWSRNAAVVAVTAVVTAVVATVACGLGAGWVDTLGAGSARRSLMSLTTGVGVAIGSLIGHENAAVHAAHVAGVAGAAAIVVALLLRSRAADPVRGLGLALLAVAALGAVVQPWYLLWSLPLLAAVAGPRLSIGLAAASTVLCLLVLPSGRHVIRPPLYGVPAVLVAACAYAASRRGSTRGGHRVLGRRMAEGAGRIGG